MTADDFGKLWDGPLDYIESQTSGSTGKPKIIRLSKRDMRISADTTNKFFKLGTKSRFVCPMSFDYIGARMMLVRARLCGGTLEPITPSNNFTFSGIADLVAIVPSQVDALLTCPGVARNVIIGGAQLDDGRRKKLINAGINAYTTYGMTETASHVALAPVDSEIYTALPGVTFTLDERGCLTVTMEGRDTAYIVTNDLAEIISPVQFRWLGRYDSIINSGGLKICPEEIEAVAEKVLSALNIPHTALMINGEHSEQWGCEAVLKIETDFRLDVKQCDEIRSAIKSRLSDPRKAPRKIQSVPTLPRTESGKLKRK